MTIFSLIILILVILLNIVIQLAVYEELKRAKEKTKGRAVGMFLAQTFFICYYIWAIGLYFILN